MSDLTSLRERLGADRELDAEIAVALLGMRRDDTDLWLGGERYSIREPDYYDLEGKNCELPAYTSSLDAALGLVEAKLPGWGVEILTSDRGMWRAQLWRWVNEGPASSGQWIPSYAPTPALALLSALLAALSDPRP